MVSEPFLQVHDLTVDYPSSDGRWRAVVEDFTLEITAGERVGLVGESGCGKSVVALALLGLVRTPGRIRRGEVVVAGTSLTGADQSLLRRIRGEDIGIVFQEPTTTLNPVYSIGFQLIEAVECHGGGARADNRARVERLLSSVSFGRADRTSSPR